MDKDEQVIKWLKEFKRLAYSRFIGLLGVEYDKVKEILESMESRGLIKRQEETNATYWILNEEDNNEN